MKALVIGATGIIGNHIVRALLADGVLVRAFARGVTPALNLEGLQVERIQGDAQDEVALTKAMQGCDWVFHSAAYYPQRAFGQKKHLEVALRGIKAVLNAVSKNSGIRLVYTSSLTTIGMPSWGNEADESFPYQMIQRSPHPYFLVKYRMEEEVLQCARRGLSAVIVNPTGCFGPYELKPPSLCLVPQLINKKIPVYVEHDLNVVDVADVARGHLLAAKKGRVGERYILGGHNVTSGWLIRKICEIGKVPPPRLEVPLQLGLIPAWISEALAYALDKPPRLPILGLRFLQYGQHFTILKAKEELDYSVSNMDSCLESSIKWFKKIWYC